MPGKRKPPSLRKNGKYYIASIYKPNGKRTNISFGTADYLCEGDIYAAFYKWRDLFCEQPAKVLSFRSPYDALEQIINPSQVTTVGELINKYYIYTKKTAGSVRGKEDHPDLQFTKRVKRFLEPYASWPVSNFGPDELLDVQKTLVNYKYIRGSKTKRYTRGGVNDVIKWVRKIYQWGMGRQIITAAQVQGLEEVKPLKMGRTKAPDKLKRVRVTEEEFQKVLNSVSGVVKDMLQLIWHTAMRPYEVCNIRPFDILRDNPECWLYIPGRNQTPVGQHKTTQFERIKVIPLTSRCQKILNPRIKDFTSKKYLFSPQEAMQEFLEKKLENRKTPLQYGNRAGTNKKKHPMVSPGEKYNHHSLRNACKRGCTRAGVEVFVPYDLRRSIATGARSILGKEAAKVLLGHTKTDTTDIYLLEEVQETMKIATLLDSSM